MTPAQAEEGDLADFETALADPAAYYADPETILADRELSLSQKRRFLTEWAQDLADRQQADGEGMIAPGQKREAAEAELLRRVNASLKLLEGQPEQEDGKVERSHWKRLLPLRG
ncbi:hypothetical protein L6Q21_01845 [Sandaracinobacter sp. RS1-74]|uniref:hypothetical protein n=1 Tax=Sandaracinobacteroides sayramensis TaxID=2913411 RepID=UPI001EDAA456|nr:hypothetical protein [Sandaracinobacteroides sayramensis]MCG2839723.1 hypothetical protein [Sandaracinobacteroides sayramensis]